MSIQAKQETFLISSFVKMQQIKYKKNTLYANYHNIPPRAFDHMR